MKFRFCRESAWVVLKQKETRMRKADLERSGMTTKIMQKGTMNCDEL